MIHRLLMLIPRYRRLYVAATSLYEAGYWRRNGVLAWQDEDYWHRLKVALGRP